MTHATGPIDLEDANAVCRATAIYGEHIHTYKIAPSTEAHNGKIIQALQRAARQRAEHIGVGLEASLEEQPVPSAKAPEVQLVDLVATFNAQVDLEASSQVTYRAALRRHLAAHSNDPQFDAAYQCLQDGQYAVSSYDPLDVSAPQRKPKKTRNFPQGDFEKLHDALLDSQVMQKSIWAGRAIAWMDAGLATGLRPKEWYTVTWADAAKTTLRVTNGKAKRDVPGYLRKTPISAAQRQQFQNAKPTTRDIPVPANYRFVVMRHLAMIDQAEQQGIEFATYHRQVSQAIRRACQKTWDGKKKYTLYSLRRQFAANAADAYGVEVSSQMMGHSNPQNPAASAYGLARQAYARVGKGDQKRQKQSEAQQSAGDNVAHRPAAPCKYLASIEAKLAQEQAPERCQC